MITINQSGNMLTDGELTASGKGAKQITDMINARAKGAAPDPKKRDHDHPDAEHDHLLKKTKQTPDRKELTRVDNSAQYLVEQELLLNKWDAFNTARKAGGAVKKVAKSVGGLFKKSKPKANPGKTAGFGAKRRAGKLSSGPSIKPGKSAAKIQGGRAAHRVKLGAKSVKEGWKNTPDSVKSATVIGSGAAAGAVGGTALRQKALKSKRKKIAAGEKTNLFEKMAIDWKNPRGKKKAYEKPKWYE